MRYFHYLLSLCLLTNCATFNRVRSINILDKAQLKSEQIYAVIPYESVSKIQIIKVFIEGKDYRFIFDTGGYTVLSQDLIETSRGGDLPTLSI